MDEKDFVYMLNNLIEDLSELAPKKLSSQWDEGFYTAIVKANIRIHKDIDLINDWLKQE